MTDTVDTQYDPGAVHHPPVIAGFTILKLLGSGGMSAVWHAEQNSLGRKVAVKVMASHVAASPQARERFMREARAAAAVNHPNVVGIIDVGQSGDQLYMILELVTGGDAADLAEELGGRIPEARALAILIDCAKGLQALEEAQLVHRDLKPANIFLARDGTAKLGDLGLARSADGADRMTVTGNLVGTPAFMSPEQASGEKLDIRSDIYALGATLFALVTGRQPFVANTPIAVAAKALVEPAPDPRTLAPELSAGTANLILRCMAKDPADRCQTPLALRSALEDALAALGSAAGTSITKPPTTRSMSTAVPARTSQRWLIALVIIAVVATAVVASMLRWSTPASEQVVAAATAGSEPAVDTAVPEVVATAPGTPDGSSVPTNAPVPLANPTVDKGPTADRWPPMLQSSDIGNPVMAGSFSDDRNGSVTVTGTGSDIGSTTDQFRYAYLKLSGDGSITAHLESQYNTDHWAKAGLMLRDSLAPDARHVSLFLTPNNGLEFQVRTTTGGTTTCTDTGAGTAIAPVWLRLTRNGTTVTAARSSDGRSWTTVNAGTVAYSQDTIYAGLAVTSHNVTTPSTAVFNQVATTGTVATTDSPAPRVSWASAQGQDAFGHYAVLTVKGVSSTLRWIPPGTCVIGATEDEPGFERNERLATVTFTRGCWLAATECTQELWTAVMGSNPSRMNGPTLPVHLLTMLDVIAFTHALRPLAGQARIRLPSRAEWERACRAGTTTMYFTGDDPMSLKGHANLCDLDHLQRYTDRRKTYNFSDGFTELAPVASLRANNWGFFDMHGNVFEFCLGAWSELPETCEDPEINDDPDSNVGYIRGGAYDSEDVITTRCAALPYTARDRITHDVGFRFLIEQP